MNGRPLVSASLELTVKDVSLLFANHIAAHRVSKAWTETGATWTCANDTVPTNSTNNCTSASAWSMTTGADLAIRGGYCSAYCADDSECPSSTACVQGAFALPCNNGSCGAGYFCLDTGSAQACLPTCSSNADCTGGRECSNNNCVAFE